LRREELAEIANVSLDYIVEIEQGRRRHVSRPILAALADALRLSADERTYLFAISDVPGRDPAVHGISGALRAGPSTQGHPLGRGLPGSSRKGGWAQTGIRWPTPSSACVA
jgi:transcriptional regulator with XRE-family HTH domain